MYLYITFRNACPVKEEVVAPFWANNTRGEVLALLNLYPFEQYVHWEKCSYEQKQMFCRQGCRLVMIGIKNVQITYFVIGIKCINYISNHMTKESFERKRAFLYVMKTSFTII